MGILGGRPQLSEGSDEGGLSPLACCMGNTGKGRVAFLIFPLPLGPCRHLPSWPPEDNPGEEHMREHASFKMGNTALAHTDLGLCRNRWGQQHRPP